MIHNSSIIINFRVLPNNMLTDYNQIRNEKVSLIFAKYVNMLYIL